MRPTPPCVVGYEVAGEVESVGEGVESHAVGDRVMAGTRFGGYAELVSRAGRPGDLPLPESLSFEQGAAFPVNYTTAYAGAGDHGRAEARRAGADPRRRRRRRASRRPRSRSGSAPRSSARPRPPSTTRSALRASITRSTTAPRTSPTRRCGSPAATGSTSIIDAVGPPAFARTTGSCARAGGWSCTASRRCRPATSATSRPCSRPRADAAGDDAVVEEPADDEREQGRLRAQHAQVVGRRGARPACSSRSARASTPGDYEPVVAEAFPFERAADAHRFIAERRNVGKVVLDAVSRRR